MRSGIALGSNIGDRLANLREAYQRVLALNTIGAVVRTSSIYETSPVDSEPGTEEYFNAVLETTQRMSYGRRAILRFLKDENDCLGEVVVL